MKTSRSEEEITAALDRLKRDRAVLHFLWLLAKEQRLYGHQSRLATVTALGLPVPPRKPSPDVYAPFVDLETQLLFEAPELFVELKWRS